MTNSTGRRSYNFRDVFGNAVESNSIPADTLLESGPWCNQADGIFEQDNAIREQGGGINLR